MTAFRSRKSVHVAALVAAVAFGVLQSTRPLPAAATARPSAPVAALPTSLSDAEFWALESDISEPDGYFRITDNFTSNELEIGQLATLLHDTGVEGGVYLGVGPEQNFTYIAAVRPMMAFIVDIRRQAAVQHLMFKAVFEMAADRGDFISLLFAKPKPPSLDSTASIQTIWEGFSRVATDRSLADKTFARIVERLTRTHRFTFTADESAKLEAVYRAFVEYGPDISTRGSAGGGRGGNVTFADLTGWSTDRAGQPQSFLSSDDNYQYVKHLQEKNLIVPATGDFGGPKTLRAIGAYLHRNGGIVSAFYVSNVEQYLFMDGKERAFYDNVATLPLNSTSVFIRPYSLRRASSASQSLCPIDGFLGAVQSGHVMTNNDALSCGR
jgi:hypothetical protein